MNFLKISHALMSTRKLCTTPLLLKLRKESPMVEHINNLEDIKPFNSQQVPSFKKLNQYRQEKIEEDKKKLQWRTPITKQPGAFRSKLEIFNMDQEKEPSGLRMIVMPLDFSIQGIKNSLASYKIKKERFLQQYIPERHEILGSDLAAAHFIIYRGGKVKFVGHQEWSVPSEKDPDTIFLPKYYDPSYEIEKIDCSNMKLYYEGLENIRRLTKLKNFSLKNVKLFDDWGLDRVSGSEFISLETLDISGTSVTANGLSALYRMSQLKKLIINQEPEDNLGWHLTISMVMDILPNLEIVQLPKNDK